MRRKRTEISRKIAWTKVRLTLPDLDQAKNRSGAIDMQLTSS
jgi:hypothetical protein